MKMKRADMDCGFFPISEQEAVKFVNAGSVNEGLETGTTVSWYEANKDRLDAAIVKIAVRYKVPEIKTDLFFCDNDKRPLRQKIRTEQAKAVKKLGLDPTGVCCGAFKTVYITKDGYALKTNLGKGGLKTEIRASSGYPGLTCFPKLVSYSSNMSTALVECVISKRRFEFEVMDEIREIYGMDTENIVFALRGETYRMSDTAVCNDEFFGRLEESPDPEWQSLRDLRSYMKKHYLSDIDTHNWGLAMRDGRKVPVVYDYDL